MKAQILKIAGVKNEKEFYKKFPTEEAFMKKHGKAFKKAQAGINLQQGFAGGFNPTSMGVDENFQIPVDLGQKPGVGDYLNAYGSDAINAIGGIAGGISAIGGEKKKLKQVKQNRMVSDVQLRASRTLDEKPERQYVRPEDIQNTGEEYFPIYGVGTNVLAKDGIHINPANKGKFNATKKRTGKTTEELTHSPNPLTRKRAIFAQNAAKWHKGEDGLEIYQNGGFADFMNSGGTDVASKLVGGAFDNNGGYQTGAAVGNAVKMIPGVGPVVGAIAAPVLGTIGGALDQAFGPAGKIKKEEHKLERNINNITGNQFGQSIQSQYNNYMRTGGNIRQNSDMDGDLQIGKGHAQTLSYNPFLPDNGETVMFRGPSHADGGMPIAYGNNGVEVEGGEPAVKLNNGGEEENLTVYGNLKIPDAFAEIDPKAKGKKFKNYIDDLSKIESKQNKIIEKSTDELNNLDVITSFDKLKLKSLEANQLGANMKLKDIADKKIKAADLQNAINQTAEEYGISAEHLAKGKYKKVKKDEKAQNGKSIYDINQYKPTSNNTSVWTPESDVTHLLADPVYQNLQTQEPNTIELSDEDLGIKSNNYMEYIKKYFPEDQWDNAYKIMIAESSGDPSAVRPEDKNPGGGKDTGLFQINSKYHPEAYSQYDLTNPEENIKAAADIWKKRGWNEWTSAKKKGVIPTQNSKISTTQTSNNISSNSGLGFISQKIDDNSQSSGIRKPKVGSVMSQNSNDNTTQNSNEGYNRSWLMDAFNEVLPYIRPSDAEPLNYNQLSGEMYALSNNQLEPVKAQGYHPQLDVPYDVSLQDQLNEITAQERATQRMLGYNPAVQANLAAQAYNAKNKVLGEQFRMNQAKKDQVYSQNRATSNDAQLKNLQIYDQQYQRQAQAKANTKDVVQKALNSISAKYAQNQLENRTLQTYENMYNYRFGDNFRAQNYNGFFQPNMNNNSGGKPSLATPDFNPNNLLPVYNNKGEVTSYKIKQEDNKKSRNGSIVKAIKNL